MSTTEVELDPHVEKINAEDEAILGMSLEALILHIHTERLKALKEQIASELKELNERHESVRKLHDVQKAVNQATGDDGTLNLKNNSELADLLSQAKELGAAVDPTKMKYSKEDRNRLIENLKMTSEDLHVKNDMQMQSVQRLTNERFESFQMAKNTIKPLHDDKHNKARKMEGR